MDKEKREAFKKELQAVMDKYNVCICYSFSGDTFGVCDERFFIMDNKTMDAIMECRDTMLDTAKLEDL